MTTPGGDADDRNGKASIELQIAREVPGRAVLARPDGTIFIGRGYDIHSSSDDGSSWELVGSLPRSPLRRVVGVSRLACRLLRQEVRALAQLSEGRLVAANREGLFHGLPGEGMMAPCRVEDGIEDGSPHYMPPMRLEVGPQDVVIWGEYGATRPTRAIRLFASSDGGESFGVVHTFRPEEIGHIHNLIYDPGLDHYWVLAGDHGSEPGIGMLSADLERFEWLVKGEQRYRAVEVFDFGDCLIYATDTEMETNALVSLDKKSGRTEKLRQFEGSCIYACRFGSLFALTTTVEPSRANFSREATLWLSRNGEDWRCALRTPKDRWHADYFQFGSLVLPAGASDREVILVSGQAVEGLDGRCAVAHVAPEAW